MKEVAKRRREDPAVRRTQILEAAKSIFRSLGFQASTVDRIAAEAGVSVGLLYRFFESKSAIIEAIILEDVEDQLEQIGAVIEASSGDPLQIGQMITSTVAKSNFSRERLGLMFEIAAEICRNPRLQKFLRKKRAELQERLAERLISKGLDRRSTLATIDRIDAASAVASGLAMHAMVYSDATSDLDPGIISRLVNAAVFPDEEA